MQGTTLRFDGTYTGHDTVTYNSVLTSQNKAHNHGGATGGMSGNNPHSHTYAAGGYNDAGEPYLPDSCKQNAKSLTTDATDINHTHSIASDGGIEARPVCVGIEYYRRTA